MKTTNLGETRSTKTKKRKEEEESSLDFKVILQNNSNLNWVLLAEEWIPRSMEQKKKTNWPNFQPIVFQLIFGKGVKAIQWREE